MFIEIPLFSAGHSVISHLWGLHGGPARIAMHVGYPLGAMLGPLIAMPFVMSPPTSPAAAQELISAANSSVMLMTSTIAGPTRIAEVADTSRMEVAYGMVGAAVGVLALVFLCLHFCVKTATKPLSSRGKLSFSDVWRPAVWADGNSCYGIVIALSLVGYYVVNMGAIKGTQVYLVTYAVDSGFLTNQRAALLNSLTFGAGTQSQLAYFAVLIRRHNHMSCAMLYEQYLDWMVLFAFLKNIVSCTYLSSFRHLRQTGFNRDCALRHTNEDAAGGRSRTACVQSGLRVHWRKLPVNAVGAGAASWLLPRGALASGLRVGR